MQKKKPCNCCVSHSILSEYQVGLWATSFLALERVQSHTVLYWECLRAIYPWHPQNPSLTRLPSPPTNMSASIKHPPNLSQDTELKKDGTVNSYCFSLLLAIDPQPQAPWKSLSLGCLTERKWNIRGQVWWVTQKCDSVLERLRQEIHTFMDSLATQQDSASTNQDHVILLNGRRPDGCE